MAQPALATPTRVGDRMMSGALVVGGLWLVFYTALIAISQANVPINRLAADVAYLVPITAAAVLAGIASVVTSGRTRAAWILLTVSNTFWLVGEVIWVAYANLNAAGPPAVSMADPFYLASYVVAVPAVLIGFARASALRRLRGVLDALLVAIVVATIGWRVVLEPVLPWPMSIAKLVTFSYPLLGVVVVTLVIAISIAGHRSVPFWVLGVGGAFAVAGVTDAAYSWAVAVHKFNDDGWLNIGWQVQAVLLCFAAIAVIRQPDSVARTRQLDNELKVLPFVIAACAVTALTLTDLLPDDKLSPETLTIIILLFGGLLLRQLLVIRDRTQLASRLKEALREQERLAITDSLTGVYNRRFFQEVLRIDAERAERAHQPLSLILADLDEFKRINDTYGHPAGDTVLTQVAERIRRSVRHSDVVARYGGEEFVCLLPGADEEIALEVGEQIRRAVARDTFSVGRDQVRVSLTSSVGVATAGTRGGTPIDDVDALVDEADGALYRAKAYGRNRVMAGGAQADMELDAGADLPSGLVWMADQIDAKLSHQEHSTAVARWSALVGERLGLDNEALRRVVAAGRLHDIGKISVPDSILTKPSPLDAQEWAELCRHPDESARLLTEFGQRPDLADVVAAHHERWDGHGYPRGTAGENIPIEARVVAVTDAWAAMRAERLYAPALSADDARRQIRQGRGTQFDPAVVDVFLALEAEGEIDELANLSRVDGSVDWSSVR